MSQLTFAPSINETTASITREATQTADRIYIIYTQMQRRRRIAISFCLAQTLLAITHIATLPWRDDETDVSLSLVITLSQHHYIIKAFLLRFANSGK